jgi:glycosyltransferase involved in cell wall biosynthesis
MHLGIAIEETWGFFNEIYADLTKQYQTTVFHRRSWQLPVFHARINQYLFRHDLQAFMRANDVVFFEWTSGLLAAATRLPKVCGIVTRLHRYEMYGWVNRVNWDAVDKIIVVSHAKKQEFIARFPEQAAKIVVSGPSTNLEKFRPQPKVFQGDIGILCHLTPRKRVYDLILTFYELTQHRNDLHLHIAGGMDSAFEDYYDALHYLVKKLNLQDKVTFYGNVTDTWDWYHKIDIFISNSYSEGLQVAPMEAMASGCYCLSHRWDGADELLPQENLFYTSTELKEKILRYYELPETQKHQQKAQMHALAGENFDIRHTIAQIIETIEEVAASQHSKNGAGNKN